MSAYLFSDVTKNTKNMYYLKTLQEIQNCFTAFENFIEIYPIKWYYFYIDEHRNENSLLHKEYISVQLKYYICFSEVFFDVLLFMVILSCENSEITKIYTLTLIDCNDKLCRENESPWRYINEVKLILARLIIMRSSNVMHLIYRRRFLRNA